MWTYRTTARTATRETSYSLTFNFEAVISVEIGVSTLKVSHFNAQDNKFFIRNNLDLFKEKKDQVLVKMIAYQQKVPKFYNKRIHHREFKTGDLVLRKVTLNTRVLGERALRAN